MLVYVLLGSFTVNRYLRDLRETVHAVNEMLVKLIRQIRS